MTSLGLGLRLRLGNPENNAISWDNFRLVWGSRRRTNISLYTFLTFILKPGYLLILALFQRTLQTTYKPAMKRKTVGWFNEFERLWKETAVVYSKSVFCVFIKRFTTDASQENLPLPLLTTHMNNTISFVTLLLTTWLIQTFTSHSFLNHVLVTD